MRTTSGRSKVYVGTHFEEFDGKLVVGKCDVEENDDIAMEFGVRNIPTILFFKGGQLVDKFVGAASKATLTEKFQALL